MDRTEAKRVIEALLFATDVPLPPARIKSLLGEIDSKLLRELVQELRMEYEQDSHSFALVEIGGGYQIYTRPEYAKWVQELFKGKRSSKLTAASLETMAIVAYKQPIIKADIESIRGVNVDGVMATLLERNLVMVAGRDNRPGRPLLFGTTQEFLRYFGLASLSELPRIEDLEEYLKQREAERERAEAEIDAELRRYQISEHGVQVEADLGDQQDQGSLDRGGSEGEEAETESGGGAEPGAGEARPGQGETTSGPDGP
jgi:segregation and condensation protein B